MAFIASVLGRMLIALIFIVSGIIKVMHVSATAEFIERVTTLPPSLALPVGIFEIVFGVFLAIGFMTRISSILLFVFTSTTPSMHVPAAQQEPYQMHRGSRMAFGMSRTKYSQSFVFLVNVVGYLSTVHATRAVPPHEHFSQYRDKHRRDNIFWPDDPWKINRVPATFKVGFDVITDEAKGTLQYVTMEELDTSKFVEIEYVLGSSENSHRCVHPEFAKMTSYQKGVVEAERPESVGLLPKPPSPEVSLLETKKR